MFSDRMAKHIRDIGKFLLAFGATVNGGGVKVEVGFTVEYFGAVGAPLWGADSKQCRYLVGMYAVHMSVEM